MDTVMNPSLPRPDQITRRTAVARIVESSIVIGFLNAALRAHEKSAPFEESSRSHPAMHNSVVIDPTALVWSKVASQRPSLLLDTARLKFDQSEWSSLPAWTQYNYGTGPAMIAGESINGLYPLWAGIPDQRQARRLVYEHIMNPKEFWSAHPLPSYALNERNYTQHHVPCPLIDIYYALPKGHCNWRGGLWPHGNYMVAHGLQRYGFREEALTLARKSYEVAAADADIYEWYNAETAKPEGAHPLCAGVEVLMRVLPTELATDFNPVLIEDAGKPLEDGEL
jgi:hypothetical protein